MSFPFVLLGEYVLFSLPVLWSHIIMGLLWLGFWFILPRYLEEIEVMPERTAYPFFVGLLMTLALPSVSYFTGETLALIAFICAFASFMRLNNERLVLLYAFNSAMLLSIATLFDTRYWLLFFILVVGIFVYRLFKVRIILVSLFGVALFLYIVASLSFLQDVSLPAWHHLWQVPFYDFQHKVPISLEIVLPLGVFTLFALMSYAFHVTRVESYKLHVRLNYTYILSSTIIYAVWLALFLPSSHQLLGGWLIYLSILISWFFTTNSRKYAKWLLLVFAILCVGMRLSSGFIQ